MRPGGSLSVAQYPRDHPLMTFITAHIRHSMLLVADWPLQPLAPAPDEKRSVPPVYYLRALPGRADEVTDPEERTGYWTKDVLPTLDIERLKVIEYCDHLGIWKPGKVEGVTAWLKEMLEGV